MRAVVDLVLNVTLLGGALVACTPEPPSVAPAPVASAPIVDASTGWDAAKWGTFHSKRFQLAMNLPDGAAWRIDDHHASWLVATHAATSSRLRVRVFYEDRAASRDKCEIAAHADDPELASPDGARVVDARTTDVVPGWDGKLAIFIRDPQKKDAVVEGHVQAFAANVRKCVAVDYVTNARAADAVGARLSDIADRVVHGLHFEDDLGAPPREPLPK